MDIRLNVAYASVGLAEEPGSLPQEAPQLVRIQPMFANDSAVQEKDRDVEAMAASQGRIAIDVDYVDGREGERAPERMQLPQHLVAELTVVTMNNRESRFAQ